MRGRTSRPKICISCSFGQPEMMNWVTPASPYSRNADATSSYTPTTAIAGAP